MINSFLLQFAVAFTLEIIRKFFLPFSKILSLPAASSFVG